MKKYFNLKPSPLEIHESCDLNRICDNGGGVYIAPVNYTAYFSVDTFATNVVDPVGAGDALLSYSTLGLLATGSLVKASILGSIAAACECEVDGNVPIKIQNVLSKIDRIEKMTSYHTKLPL